MTRSARALFTGAPALQLCLLVCLCLVAGLASAPLSASELRHTAIVRAVQQARPSVVNIRGEKTLPAGGAIGHLDAQRRVNGMGTGVVIDSRGYVLTNYHVVQDVESIRVTLDDERSHTAKIVSHDAAADLAIIKVDGPGRLPVINIGSSRDLMLGEPVIALGNPYGYQHSVTRGIISALHRRVQVTEAQAYDDLIQTDASINPGNSGGPLLNIDGQVIGITVAVRAGAQGIGFAIPIDHAMHVAARLLSTRADNRCWHGMTAQQATAAGQDGYVVGSVSPGSPAHESRLQRGDVITAVNSLSLKRSTDLERALLDEQPGGELELLVQRGERELKVPLVLARLPEELRESNNPLWQRLGMKLTGVPQQEFVRYGTRYRGGLRVIDVRPGSPAAEQGIHPGDILLGMHIWETITLENVSYILNRRDFQQLSPLKFYVLRGDQTLFGHLRVSAQQ